MQFQLLLLRSGLSPPCDGSYWKDFVCVLPGVHSVTQYFLLKNVGTNNIGLFLPELSKKNTPFVQFLQQGFSILSTNA